MLHRTALFAPTCSSAATNCNPVIRSVLFCLVFGVVYLLLGVVGFVMGAPGVSSIAGMTMEDSKLWKVLPKTLELGKMDHIVHCLLGVVFLAGGLLGGRDA